MSILMPAMIWFLSHGSYTFGGAKPVPVNSSRFRNYVRGDLIVSAAGVITNLILALVCSVIFVVLGLIAGSTPAAAIPVLDTAQRMMVYGIWLNLILCFFNLIPIPPLDGSHLLYHVLPPRAGSWYRGLHRFGYLPIFALMFLFRPVMAFLLAPAFKGMGFLLHIILPFSVGDGWNIFQS